jgi:hypothetical protein
MYVFRPFEKYFSRGSFYTKSILLRKAIAKCEFEIAIS